MTKHKDPVREGIKKTFLLNPLNVVQEGLDISLYPRGTPDTTPSVSRSNSQITEEDNNKFKAYPDTEPAKKYTGPKVKKDGGRKTRNHHKGGKKTMKKKSRKYRK